MLLGCFMLVGQRASASRWTAVASTCAIGVDQVGDAGIYAITGGSAITFSDSNTGEIKTRCNVTNPLDSGVPTWNTLTVGYQDPDGSSPSLTYQVTVTLYRVGKSTGNYSTVAIFDSGSFADKVATSHSVTFSHTFDFTNYAYWVTLDLVRNDSTKNPSVWFVGLN